MGKQQVLSETHKTFWIMRGLSDVKRVRWRCVPCKRRQMAPLLKEQTTADKPPFTFVGIDYFGPLLVK